MVKIEKWFHTYQRFRSEFENFEEFIHWYNKNSQRTLKPKEMESSENAFWNILPVGEKFGIKVRLFRL
jgi:putative transposase